MNFTWKKITSKLAVVGLAVMVVFTSGMVVEPQKAQAAMSAYSIANGLIDTGNRYLGRPYRYGSPSGVTSTFDCSSFTQYIYRKYGIILPRTAVQQSKLGYIVSRNNLAKGDLVFFWTPSSNGRPEHVGIYAGGGYVLHTYGAGGVKYTNMNTSYWRQHYIAGRRILNY